MNLVTELHAIAAALIGAGVRHAICGGVAVTIHGATRSTKDIDILIAPDDVPAAMEVVLPQGPLWVVPRDVLLTMKRMAGRNQDLADLEKLGPGMGRPRSPDGGPAAGVAERLERLATIYVAERDVDARRRLAAERPVRHEPFADAVARRLAELRALDELASHLRGRRR